MARKPTTKAKPSTPPDGKSEARGVIEEFVCEGGGVIYACAGEHSIPTTEKLELGKYTHLDVTIGKGVDLPERFACYFDGNRARCLSAKIYTQIKQALVPKPKAS